MPTPRHAPPQLVGEPVLVIAGHGLKVDPAVGRERLNRGVEVRAEHGERLADLVADRLGWGRSSAQSRQVGGDIAGFLDSQERRRRQLVDAGADPKAELAGDECGLPRRRPWRARA